MAQQQWNQTPGGVAFGYPDAKSTEIERTRHIPDSLTYLEKSIASLQQLTSTMSDRLEPVSAQQEPRVDGQQNTPATGVRMADTILAQARCVDQVCHALEGMLQRLQI